MTFFTLASWLLTLTSFLILLLIWLGPRYLLIKPSIILSAFFFLQLQIPSGIHASEIEKTLADPLPYLVFIHLLPVVVLGISTFTFRRSAEDLYSLCRNGPISTPSLWSWDVATLNLAMIADLAWFLSVIPWSSTALAAIITQDPNMNLIREDSLKLLPSIPLRYGYALMTAVVAPLLAIVYSFRIRDHIQQGKWILLGSDVVIILVILVATLLAGSRAPSAITLVCVIFAISLRSRTFLSLPFLAVGVVIVLALPTVLTLLREDSAFTPDQILHFFLNMVDRSFGRTIVDVVGHMQYVQTFGFFGVDGDPFVSRMLGKTPIDVFNVVGLAYYRGIQSVSSNVNYASAYYDCYGFWAFAPCVLLACLLDASVIVMRHWTSGLWIIACIAGCAGAVSALTSTFFTTAMLTFGFAVIPPVCIVLSRLNGLSFLPGVAMLKGEGKI